MNEFIGFFALEGTLSGIFQCTDTSGIPSASTSAPTFRIYSPEGTLMNNGTGTSVAHDAGNVVGCYRFTKSLASGDGYSSGNSYLCRVQGAVSGNARVGLFYFGVI